MRENANNYLKVVITVIEIRTVNMGAQREWYRQKEKKSLVFGMEDHTPFRICHFGTNVFPKQSHGVRFKSCIGEPGICSCVLVFSLHF